MKPGSSEGKLSPIIWREVVKHDPASVELTTETSGDIV
jgi:hypothetical protein